MDEDEISYEVNEIPVKKLSNKVNYVHKKFKRPSNGIRKNKKKDDKPKKCDIC